MRALCLVRSKDTRYVEHLYEPWVSWGSQHHQEAAWEACCIAEALSKGHVALFVSSFGSDLVLFVR